MNRYTASLLRLRNVALCAGVFALFAGYALLASADDAPVVAPGAIAFPVSELGDCPDKETCRVYCNEPAHIPACADFARAHGLMNNDDATRARTFARSLEEGNGPGGCATPETCKTYCEDTAHLEECVRFADTHGVKLGKNAPPKTLLAYLKSGGTMPGGCTSRDSCEAYCRDLNHAEECIVFAEKAGLVIGSGPAGERGKSPDDIRRFISLMQRGETPGACTSKEACEAYCRDQGHFEECTAFAERAGLMDSDEANDLRELGGKGPGGCSSRLACEAYCREASHRDECYRFAEEHGLLSDEGIRNAKEGLVRLRSGLENASPDVAACVRTTLGAEAVERMMRGEFTPGPEIGEQLKTCFERFGDTDKPRDLFRAAPADVVACLKGKLGGSFEKIRNGIEPLTPETADTLRVCLAKTNLERSGGMFMSAEGSDAVPGMALAEFLQNAPQGIRECVARTLGVTTIPRASELSSDEEKILRGCFESFRPAEASVGEVKKPEVPMRPPEAPPSQAQDDERMDAVRSVNPADSGGGGTTPALLTPEAVQCLRARVNAAEFENLMRGGKAGPEAEATIRKCLEKFLDDQSDSEHSITPPPGVPAGGTLPPPPPAGPRVLPAPTGTPPPPSSLGPLQNATAQVSKNPFDIFVRFLLGL